MHPGFPPAAASPMITVACVAIGLFVLVTIMYAYHKDRRKMKKSQSSQETADFNFHEFLHSGTSCTGSSLQQSFEFIRQKVLSWMPKRLSSSGSSNSIRNFRVLNLPEEDSRILQMPNYGAINSADDEVL